MSEVAQVLPLIILLVGVAIALAIPIKFCLERIGVPVLVGYLVLGFLIDLANYQWQFLSQVGNEIFAFLAQLGVIALLFRVGLESNLAELIGKLPSASTIWIGNILVSASLGFVTPYFLLGLDPIPSLFVSVAMTATSVGVSVGVWQEEDATKSENGELLLDVAEMDDISGVILLGLLLAIAPELRDSGISSILPVIARTSGVFFIKAVVFGAFCFFFSRYIEEKLTKSIRKIEPPPDPMLEVVGISFIIAALSEILGFSFAIGGFFAGLVFSRDPEAVKIDASFESLYDLFTPFFFIGIGLQIEPDALISAVGIGLVLLVAAVLGKVIGTIAPAVWRTSWTGAVLLGISLVPRAEITTIVMERGLQLGEWAVPPKVFAAMVLVVTVTSIVAPLLLRHLLQKWPQTQPGESS
jgi:Kef-type K+ transport system membrane component KefB